MTNKEIEKQLRKMIKQGADSLDISLVCRKISREEEEEAFKDQCFYF